MYLIAKRYADAILEIGIEKGTIESICEEVTFFNNQLSENEEYLRFLTNPVILLEDKKESVKDVFGDRLSPYVYGFIDVLLDNDRIEIVDSILKRVISGINEHKKIIDVRVETAFKLDESQLNDIIDLCKKKYDVRDVKLDIVEEPELIGGMRVIVGDDVMDTSIREKIKTLKREIK